MGVASLEATLSKFVRVKTQLRDPVLVKRALDDLQIRYEENGEYVHQWTKTRTSVPILVNQGHTSFGLREGDDGIYELVGDDMSMGRLKRTIGQVQQRYAYHKVLAETELAGFSLIEEAVGDDNVIRMTVRRWS